jgi:hypothetical protein
VKPERYARLLELCEGSAAVKDLIEQDVQTRSGRVLELVEQRRAIKRIIAERAVFHDHQDVPGGKTGMVVTTRKQLRDGEVFKEHAFDVTSCFCHGGPEWTGNRRTDELSRHERIVQRAQRLNVVNDLPYSSGTAILGKICRRRTCAVCW